ncbi:MAG: adenylyltransferase/cytidyltransferase family protein, partial [Elusimicrobia bacterium]|nr:adenylyltransferase/cytidyltransferase family protein [Elusimicrobiota bacterium]
LKSRGETIVMCHGVFDLLHPGHIRHFEAAKKHGTILVVTITADKYVNKGPGRPVFPQLLRAESVAALSSVDYVAVNDAPTAVNVIEKIKPDFYVKGSDYQDADKDVTKGIAAETKALRSAGGELIFTDEITFSSTSLLNSYFPVYPEEARGFLRHFSKSYGSEEIIKRMNQLKNLSVLVLGEAIVDEYYYCQAMGKSPKESIVSTRYMSQEAFPGGALAAANHLAGFVGNVHLVTGLGREESYKQFIKNHLKLNISTKFFHRNSPTIIKRRFVDPAFLTKMFEISYLDDSPLAADVEKSLVSYLDKTAPEYDIVFIADYGHGLIGGAAVDTLCSKSRFLAVNAQTNSANYGYNPITKYGKADYVCIDEAEMRLALRDKFSPLENLMKSLTAKSRVENLMVTRGHKGSMAYAPKEGLFYQTPVFSEKVVDRTGAGDAFFSVTAPCVSSGFPLDLVSFIGNAAGALAVTIVCNREAVEPPALYKFITALLK